MKRLIEKIVFSGFITACRLATVPTRRSPLSVKATTEGVVRPPSAFSRTVGSPPSITATHELVVPRSMPIVFATIIPPKLRWLLSELSDSDAVAAKNLSRSVADTCLRINPARKEAGACAPASDRTDGVARSLLDLQHARQRGVIRRVEAVDRSPAVDEALHETDLLRVREDVVDLVVEIVD